jgi:hypothetical protein
MRSNPGQAKIFVFFQAAAVLFYTVPKLCIFQRSIAVHHCMKPHLSGVSVTPTSQVRASAMLVLPIVGN